MNHPRPRLRVFVLAVAALVAAAAFAAVGGATTSATAPSNTTRPSVSGNAKQGSTLTTTSGSWSGDTPISFAYKWQSCDTGGNNCTFIAGATSTTYVVQASDVNKTIRSYVTATNAAGSASQNSNATDTVTPAAAPTNSSLPAISGTATVGSTLTASNGNWNGQSPITYAYDWRRCDAAGAGCSSINNHSDNQTYVVTSSDLGHTLRVVVTATNSVGQAQATSNASSVVTAGGPVNTVAPVVSGTPNQGSTLTTTTGTWTSSTTITYAYEWDRCDSDGNNCNAISSATGASYVLTSADVGHKMRSKIKATNTTGSNTANSTPVGPVAAGPSLPPGAVKLPNGEISVPASSIPDSDRLTVTSVKYSPSAIHGKSPISMTIKVIDQNKYVVSGVLVYVLPVPSNWASKAPETPTGQNGTVSVTVIPTIKAPKRGSLVLFVRARTPQGNLLAGSSTRRLVSVRIFGS